MLPKPASKRDDVALVLFPNSDLRPAMTHPALVVQVYELGTGLLHRLRLVGNDSSYDPVALFQLEVDILRPTDRLSRS